MAEHKDEGHGHGGGDSHGGGHGDGHGGKKKHKKHHGGGHGGGHEEGHEGAPEWLISFADMVMLMMGFFVIMFAMNLQPKGGNAGGGVTALSDPRAEWRETLAKLAGIERALQRRAAVPEALP